MALLSAFRKMLMLFWTIIIITSRVTSEWPTKPQPQWSLSTHMVSVVDCFGANVSVVARFCFCDGRTDTLCENNDHLFGRGLGGSTNNNYYTSLPVNISLVFGIPTVYREKQSYLRQTLDSLFNRLNPEEKAISTFVIFVAESNRSKVEEIKDQVRLRVIQTRGVDFNKRTVTMLALGNKTWPLESSSCSFSFSCIGPILD